VPAYREEGEMKLSVMLFPFHRQQTSGELTDEKVIRAFSGAGIRAISR